LKAPVAEMHGVLGDPKWEAPRQVTHCNRDARPGYNTRKAHEYIDEPEVLEAKVALLAQLITKSKSFLTYTGAGISTSSGINDYASKGKRSIAMKRPKIKNGFDAQPTYAHRTLVALHRAGFLKHWVQQNHDGLPQKAGFPQECLNEIHGAWFDPSNPVVPMTGSLRGDLMEWLEDWEEKTDFCLAMGTSLCGMNADRMVSSPAERFVEEGIGHGAAIVSIQQTGMDNLASLRIFAKIDDVMALLAKRMKLTVEAPKNHWKVSSKSPALIRPDVYKVPYDSSGNLTTDPKAARRWDLRPGAKVRVTAGPGKGYVGTIIRRAKHGGYTVALPCQREGSKDQGKVIRHYALGPWWINTAIHGKCDKLPLVNV